MTALILRGDALTLPLADNTVDLIVTSPPYFSLRSYQDNGQHYAGQLGSEPTPTEYVDALLAATAEMVRVLKPSGSIWVNLGDSYAGSGRGPQGATGERAGRAAADEPSRARGTRDRRRRIKQFTREDAAWLAGVIDSDGSIGIHINQQPEGRSPSFVPWVRVGQMRPEVVHRIAELVGTGNVTQDRRGVWTWAASAQQARWVLERIHPWLLIKKRQAWAAVEVARHVEERNARGSWRPLTADDVAYRQRLRIAVLAWNQGQPDDMPVPEPRHVPLPIYPLAPREKSLHDIPHEYAKECVGRLGLILRAEVIWAKPNGLPESVTDRVRRSHEQWFHFVRQPRYYSAVDEIREAHTGNAHSSGSGTSRQWVASNGGHNHRALDTDPSEYNPLGKLPGSVWTIPTQPLIVPPALGVDHYAAFPMEWPRRIIRGWSPPGICTVCGEGRRPLRGRSCEECDTVVEAHTKTCLSCGYRRGAEWKANRIATAELRAAEGRAGLHVARRTTPNGVVSGVQGGYACACPTPDAPTRPAVVLDPFGGTGTTALVADALGRTGISVDMSADYCRLAAWRTTDPAQRAAALQVDKPAPVAAGQGDLFEGAR